MANPQMYNLTTLIKRLEAATSRLEDLASISSGASSAIVSPVAGSTTSVQSTTAVNASTAPAVTAAPAAAEPQSLIDFDVLINTEVKNYVELSNVLGGLIAEQSKFVDRCFAEQRKFLLITTKAKKPSASSNLFLELNTGMQKEVTAVGEIREQMNNKDSVYNHVSTVSEGILALVWVVDAKPADHIQGMLEASAYYGNRVMTEYKNKDKRHIEWVQSFTSILKALKDYVKKHHPNGVTWNEKEGVDAKDALVSLSSSPAAAGPPPPPPAPPPPPGPPPQLDGGPGALPAPSGSLNSVFAEINQGAAITSRLKKVDKIEMTHKNPSLRTSSVVPEKSSMRGKSPAPPPVRKPAHMKTKKPPKMELYGNKWIIENYENDHNVVVPDVEISHSIFIYRCKDVVIQIKGKCNAISISECAKTSLVADSLVSSIDVIKSTSFAIQVINKVPTIMVDGCDGGMAYISVESLDVEIFTTKTSGFNVFVAGAGEKGDFAERAVPEQMRHTIKNGHLVNEIVEHAG